MKLACSWLSVVCMYLGCCGGALGSTLASVSASGNVADLLGIFHPNGIHEVGKILACAPSTFSCSLAVPSAQSALVEAPLDESISFLGANASASGGAIAQIGHLGVNLTMIAGTANDKQIATVNATAVAEFKSRVRFFTSSKPLGATVIARTKLILHGDLGATVFGAGGGGVSLTIEDLSTVRALPPSPYADGAWGTIYRNEFGQFFNPIPGTINLTQRFTNGAFGFLGYRLTMFGGVDSDPSATSVFGARDGGGGVNGDASRSLRWGGIEGVTDEEGNPITDWVITSDEGFDFSQPFVVPEPCSLLLFAAGLFATPTRRRCRLQRT